MNERRPAISPHSPPASLWLFFGAVFGWSWLFWIVAAGLDASVQMPLGMALLLVGLLGPFLGGIGFACLTLSASGRREYWLRLIDPRRIGAKWYLVILLFVPVLMALAVAFDVLWAGGGAVALIKAKVMPFLAAPSTLVPFLLSIFIKGPLLEEPGWRGYALVQLQARWNALQSSLILGVIWALYHLPLFFMQGSFHHSWGAMSAWFWLFMAQVVCMTIVMTWIFNNTRRSTLGAILFHFVANIAATLGNVTPGTNFFATMLWISVTVLVTVAGLKKTKGVVQSD